MDVVNYCGQQKRELTKEDSAESTDEIGDHDCNQSMHRCVYGKEARVLPVYCFSFSLLEGFLFFFFKEKRYIVVSNVL